MNAAPVTQDSLLDPYATELGVLHTRQPNVLLQGPTIALDAATRLLWPSLGNPSIIDCSRAPLELPEAGTGALVLRDVAALSAGDQARLLAWLQGAGPRAQVISTTEQPLFALVTQGLFDATLYYRLNVLLLHVAP